MKFTKENIQQMIKEVTDEVETEEALKALEKKMGRRDFINKFGTSVAGIIASGGAAQFFGKLMGRMAQEKDKEKESDIQLAVGGGKAQDMMPGLVPGDKISPVWKKAPYRIQGMIAIYIPPDQIPDDYMMPAQRIPAKNYREQIYKQYGNRSIEELRTRIQSTGTWATSDYGFEYYPGRYWPDDMESPQPWLEKGLPYAAPRLVYRLGASSIKNTCPADVY